MLRIWVPFAGASVPVTSTLGLTNRHPPMTNVLAILIATSGFSAAVETSNGFVERSFENTAAGAEQFWEFAEPLIRAEGKRSKSAQ